ncbi:hypothetical protein CR205_14965 [Alteribacter lacisalsi]|uniref:Uncharacterized protein n=1 Tax=Alteribacter lacisalsi TaxID=2045244 RepID=A0A2W0H7L4_9BACI|nr:hypothetical protein [Alteribacter lacisalsi]PYZ96971.1 hypothetical protein CR205_14965 [Alteribacter lacisalsi]
MKRLFAAGAAVLFLSGCGGEEEAGYDFEGRLIANAYGELLPVFVDDNLTEEEYLAFHEDPSAVDDYEAEVYRLLVTEDTKVFIGEDEVEVSAEFSYPLSDFFSPFLREEAGIRVKTKEAFEPEVTTGSEYLLHQRPEFTPVYTAESVYLEEVSMEQLIEGFMDDIRPLEDGYGILIFTDLPFSQDNFMEARSLFDNYHFPGDSFVINQVYFTTEAGMYDDAVDAYPYYVFMNDSRVITETSDEDELRTLLEEEGFERGRSIQ